jgi:CubicO group peptidase (beta-lactamase class C family)
MRFILSLFLCMTSLLPLIAQEKNIYPAKVFNELDSIFERIRVDQKAAGFAVAIVKGDQVLYEKGFGYRDIDQKAPVTANTLFAIGSSTKAFTAALMGSLEKEGKLSLDDPAVKHLPSLSFMDDRTKDVTIKDLIAHRTGVGRHDFSWYAFNTDNRDSLIARIPYMEPTVPLRTKFQYNNFMYVVQGRIAEKITGKTWEDNIKERFFGPLEMSRSNFDMTPLFGKEDASYGYDNNGEGEITKASYFRIRGMGPAGSINSSVHEMSHWLISWLSQGTYNGKKILDTDFMTHAIQSQILMSGDIPHGKEPEISFANYGLGWMLSSYKGKYMAYHGGNIDGYTAEISFVPYEDIGIVVLANQNVSKIPVIARSYILDKLLQLSPSDWNVPKAVGSPKEGTSTVSKISGTKPSHPLEDYIGEYENPANGKVTISLHGGKLRTSMAEGKVGLKHYHYDTFVAYDLTESDTSDNGLKLNFRTGIDGKIESFVSPFENKDITSEFRKIIKAIKLGKELLSSYVGVYDIGEIPITITVQEGILYMDVPGQTNYETIATEENVFKLKTLSGFSIKFESNDQGKVIALHSIQPNGTFRATRRP